jgi:uroporphyrinogen decarboxylase
MGVTHWRHFIKPRMARLYSRVKSKGKLVIQHSCGDCGGILPELIEIGLDCYQTFQPEICDIAEVKRKYGNRLSFWGGVSTQQVLPAFTPKQVQEEIVRVGKILRPGDGFIIAPTHALPSDIPVENIQAMLEVFQNQERFF